MESGAWNNRNTNDVRGEPMNPLMVSIIIWAMSTLLDIFVIPILRRMAKSTKTHVDDEAVEWADLILRQLRKIPDEPEK